MKAGIRLATEVAALLSILAVLICFVAVPLICLEVRGMWHEIDRDVADFQVLYGYRSPSNIVAVFGIRLKIVTTSHVGNLLR